MKYVQTADQLAELVECYAEQDAFCFDVETIGEHRADTRRNRVLWIALSTTGRSDVIPMGHPHGELVRRNYPLKPSAQKRLEKGLPLRPFDYSQDQRKATAVWTAAPEQLTPSEVFSGIEPLLFSDRKKVGHNIKFDLESVAKYYGGRVPPPSYFDTMVAAYLLFSTHRSSKAPYNKPYALNAVLHRELDVEMVKGVGKEIEAHSFSAARKYTVLDGRWTWLLYKELRQKIEDAGLEKLMALEMDVLGVLCSMEMAGAPVDIEQLRTLDVELSEMLVEVKTRAYQAAGKEFNLQATQQIASLLFTPKKEGGRGLKPKRMTPKARIASKTDPSFEPELKDWSTDKEALTYFEGDELVDVLLEHSEVSKLHGTYVQAYLKDAPALGGKIHADFNQIGAETGRFSCREPNLQNVPSAKTPLGKKVRGLFIAQTPEDEMRGIKHQLVVADYSQIEPRVLASFSGDPVLTKAFLEGEDIYTALATPLGLSRDAGKVGILAMSYGVEATKAAAQLGITVREAERMLAGFREKFGTVYKYKSHVIREAKRRRPPHVVTMMGRRRYLPELFSESYGLRSRAERQAFNTVIQGSAADIIKLAMVRLHRSLLDNIPEAKILLQVHDELVTRCPVDRAEECKELVREAMEGLNMLKVPLIAEIKVVDRWSEGK